MEKNIKMKQRLQGRGQSVAWDENKQPNKQANFQSSVPAKGGVYTTAHKVGFVKGAQAIRRQLLEDYPQPCSTRAQDASQQLILNNGPSKKRFRSNSEGSSDPLSLLPVAPAEDVSMLKM